MQNIIVIGGGFAGHNAALNSADQANQGGGDIAGTGIELALEMRARITAHGAAEAGQDVRIVSDVIGIEIGDNPRPVITEAGHNAARDLMGLEGKSRKRMIIQQRIYPPEAGSRDQIFAARRIDENGR